MNILRRQEITNIVYYDVISHVQAISICFPSVEMYKKEKYIFTYSGKSNDFTLD